MLLFGGLDANSVFEIVDAENMVHAGEAIVPVIDNPFAICSLFHTPDWQGNHDANARKTITHLPAFSDQYAPAFVGM